MPSPFPGMDPYLEPHWLDVHLSLVGECRRALNQRLPSDLVARAEERVAVESEFEQERAIRIGPDVRVFAPDAGSADLGTIVIDAPYRLMPQDDPIVERYIRVLNGQGELVTVIEFVSPTNKRKPGLARFRQNRADLLAAGVHFVEIDLVRAGSWQALMRPQQIPLKAMTPYRAVVRTAGSRGSGYLFPISFRQAVPDVPVPLRAGEAPVPLPLQAMLASVYDEGRYGRTIDYDGPVTPRLNAVDAAWVATLPRPQR